MNNRSLKIIFCLFCIGRCLSAQEVDAENTLSITANNENAIDVIKRIFNEEINDDERKSLTLLIIGDVSKAVTKVSCDLKNVPREIAASLICEKVGYEHEILGSYFVVKTKRQSSDQMAQVIFTGRLNKIFEGKISEKQSTKVISEELIATFEKISHGLTKGAKITYSSSENSMIVTGSNEQLKVIESIVKLSRLGILFSDVE